ncbi:MAG: hypothetical protein WCT04_05735 [Planctomycetota bacterium]
MIRFLCNLLVFTAAFSMVARAEIVTMSDGRVIEGEVVSETETTIVLKVISGKMTLKREEIQNIDKKKSAAAQLRDKMDELAKSKDKDNKEEWLALGDSANEKGARDEATRAYKRVIELDPNNSPAHRALGYVKSNGDWVLKTDIKDAKDQRERPAGESKKYEFTGKEQSKDRLAAMAGVNEVTSSDEKPVNCPNCHGTGVWIMLPCLNCNKSGKPGYKNMGDHLEMDQRCGGTGKVVGMYCDLCNKTGKVLLSHIMPSKGGKKEPPAGRKWCPVCNGSGVETFGACLQCKRSKWPGFLFMGDQVIRCNSCGGAGKKAMLDCANCNRTGLVNATQTDPNKQFGIGVGK